MAPNRKSSRPAYADVADKEPNFRHQAMADWLTEQTGYEADTKTVQLTMSLVNEFRNSDTFKAAMAEQESKRATREQESKQRYAARLKERADRLAAEAQAAADKAAKVGGVTAPAPAKKAAPAKAAARKAPAKKAAAPAPAKKATPTRKAAVKAPAKKATVTDISRAPSAQDSPVVDPSDVF